MTLNGTPIDLAATYRVTTNDFLANGGDGFGHLKGGADRVTAPGFDIDALAAYLGGPAAPVPPGPQNRITKRPDRVRPTGFHSGGGRGILDHVIGAAQFFYYGTGVPAAVGFQSRRRA